MALSPLKILLPLALATGLCGLGTALILSKKKPENTPPPVVLPVVETVSGDRGDHVLFIRSQGTVRPRTVTVLTSEVAGLVTGIHPNFQNGGNFREGDVLVQIETADYKAALAERQAALAQARRRLAEEEALAAQAEADWKNLGQNRGKPTDLTLRIPQIAEVQAQIDSAQAALERAQRDLERTGVKAPYNGRVIAKKMDLGQRVQTGTPLGEILSTEVAEIRLPLSLREASLIDLPMGYDEPASVQTPERPSDAEIELEYGGRLWKWPARIVRTEAEVDARSRLIYAIAEVLTPYARDPQSPERPPLKSGLFVKATLTGKTLKGVIRVPRGALITDKTLRAITPENRLYTRTVSIAAADADFVYLTDGLKEGDRIMTTPMEFTSEGMSVITSSSITTPSQP